MNAKSLCIVCGYTFFPKDNIGSWECAQHSEPMTTKGIYPCCGANHRKDPHRFRRGCVSADHNSFEPNKVGALPQPWTHWHDVTVNEFEYTHLSRVRSEAIMITEKDGYFRKMSIRRFKDPLLSAVYHQQQQQ